MAKTPNDVIVTTVSFNVHDIESIKASVLQMLRAFRVMSNVSDNVWNDIVDSIVHDNYEAFKSRDSVTELFDNKISVRTNPVFRQIAITDADENKIIVGYTNGYYQTMISLTKADKLDPITKDDLLDFFDGCEDYPVQ